MGTRYDHPNAIVRRETSIHTTAGATTESAKWASFQKMKLKKVHAVVGVAGTNAGHGYNVFVGTTSVGAISLGTAAAQANASSGALDVAVTALQQVSVKSLVDATGVASIVYEYEVDHDAVQS